jgi:uncharacterized protein (TIGR03000 family)
MRKTSLILGLVAATLFMAANDVCAQRGGGGRRGGSSYGGGRGSYGSSSYYGGRGYSPYYSSGYYGGYGLGYGYGSSPYYSSSYYAPQYYSTPDYSYSNSVVQVPPVEIRQSSYSDANSATMTVMVPNADAQIWVDDTPTAQRGMERIFHTPALQQAGVYTLKARWMEGGRAVDQQRSVRVQPGQSVMVDFRSEKLSTPRPQQ